jgi:AraC-like DNA-binding protein
MTAELQHIIRELRSMTPAKLAGAVKTHPYRELQKITQTLQHALVDKKTDPQQGREVQRAYDTVQKGTTKRLEAAQQLLAKFAETTPEIIALNNSVFSLVPSRDLLEDIKSAPDNSPDLLQRLTKACTNILEAVNIEIQQRFSDPSPEIIAIHYSGQDLDAYRRLLKNLLRHIDVNSDIFRVYNSIIRNVIEGIRIYKTQVSIARTLCREVFQTVPPSYEIILGQYTTDDLESHADTLRRTLDILNQDITMRPSIIEFGEQCRQLVDTIPTHIAERKIHMRKATRVLRIAHYIEFINSDRIPENATTSLMFCQLLFEETRRFLLTQQTHLDVALNIKSLEEASQKVEDGLRYRQYALAQLFKEISGISPQDLAVVAEQRLGDSNLLLQEIHNLLEDLIYRSPTPVPRPIRKLDESFSITIGKLHDAILASKQAPYEEPEQQLQFEQVLPNLSKFYDEELITLIRRAVKPESASSDIDPDSSIEQSFLIPVDRLQEYSESFLQIIRQKT